MPRTYRCSWCGGLGHSKRSCPEIIEVAEKHKAGGLTESWAINQTSKPSRRCTFCSKEGHNRRTCSELNEYKNRYIEYNRKFREHVFDVFRSRGIGVGTLIWEDIYCWDSEVKQKKLFIIEKIYWDYINASQCIWQETSPWRSIRIKTTSKLPLEPKNSQTLGVDKLRKTGYLSVGALIRCPHFAQRIELASPMTPLTDHWPAPLHWTEGHNKNDIRNTFKGDASRANKIMTEIATQVTRLTEKSE